MLGDDKNLRDTSEDSIKDTSNNHVSTLNNGLVQNKAFGFGFGSYSKTNKLVTALYMVTDILDKEEPMRLKLRTLGVEILSDINTFSKDNHSKLEGKISTVLSFLNIALDMNMISEMNFNILRKEFTELNQLVKEHKEENDLWLKEFMARPSKSFDDEGTNMSDTNFYKGHINFMKNAEMPDNFNKGQNTRIGVQKGSTLMKALNKVSKPKTGSEANNNNNFKALKDSRREEIISIIKERKNATGMTGVTITDIKNSAKGLLATCGEKTLQRELISMVKDNVLKKTGEKRWSKYSLN